MGRLSCYYHAKRCDEQVNTSKLTVNETKNSGVNSLTTPSTEQPQKLTFLKRYKDLRKNGALISMTLPGMIFLFCFAYLPMFGILIAFKDYKYSKGILGSDWVGFNNFAYLFGTRDAWQITFNTLYLNTLFIILGTIASIGLALLMNEVRNKWLNKIFQSTFFFPYLLSWVVVSYMTYALLNVEYGLINKIIAFFGFDAIEWYTKAQYWPAILVIVNIWKGAGYVSLIYLAGMLGISQEYYEAAKMDGANKLQQIRYITVPLIVPLITFMTLLAIGRIFYADFGLFYNVTRDSGMLYPVTDVIDTYVFRMLRTVGDIGMASAAGFYQAVVGFILVLGSNWVVRRIDEEKSLF